MPSPNGRFSASGGVARLKVCADFQHLRPNGGETPVRQAEGTLFAIPYFTAKQITSLANVTLLSDFILWDAINFH